MRPDLLFLDIRMPGMSGLQVAEVLADEWEEATRMPLLVFVTAYDQYAIQAFEHAAIDYILKPVLPERLSQTCTRLQSALAARSQAPGVSAEWQSGLAQLRSLLAASASATSDAPVAPLGVIQASIGAAIHMVPVNDVLYFEAADKYVRVITAQREYLIRMTLRQLVPQLDAGRFWQIHRGTVVRVEAVATALREDSGKVTLTLHGHADKLTVSRLYAHQFKGM